MNRHMVSKTTNFQVWKLFNCFRNDYKTTVIYQHRRKAIDNHEYTFGITTDNHDSFTVALRFRQALQSTMVHHENFKQMETSLASPVVLHSSSDGCIYGATTHH